MQRTNEQELLLNVVRLRYDDSPLFLNVKAITAQFIGNSRAGLDAEVDERKARYFGTGEIGFAGRPTISYAPQQGTDFAQTLLKPLSLESIALLSESKWDIDLVFRLAIVSLNGGENAAISASHQVLDDSLPQA